MDAEHIAADDQRTYTRVGYTLLWGLLVSIAVMALGLVLSHIQNGSAPTGVLPLDQVLPKVRDGESNAVLDLGILLLFATPLVAVLVAAVEFVRQGDKEFAAVTGVLLVLLVIAFAIALH